MEEKLQLPITERFEYKMNSMLEYPMLLSEIGEKRTAFIIKQIRKFARMVDVQPKRNLNQKNFDELKTRMHDKGFTIQILDDFETCNYICEVTLKKYNEEI